MRLRTPRHATSLVRAPTFARAMQGTRGMGGVACWLTIAPWDSTTARLLDPHALPWDQSSFLARVTQGILGMVTLVQVGTEFLRILFFLADLFFLAAIDYCSLGTSNCSSVGATCTYTGPGTYTCSCNSGYSGNGTNCAGMTLSRSHLCLASLTF